MSFVVFAILTLCWFRIGEATVYIVQPIARCTGRLYYLIWSQLFKFLSLVPGINQDTGEKDAWDGKGPTDYLKLRRQFADEPNQGQFCCDVVPLTSGKICVGDKIQVLERIPEDYKQGPLPPVAWID